MISTSSCILTCMYIECMYIDVWCLQGEMAARGNGKQKLRQVKFGDQTRADFFLTPRNANARLEPLQLEQNAVRTLTEMLHEAVSEAGDAAGSGTHGDVEVRFERG